MTSRREFLLKSGTAAVGALVLPSFSIMAGTSVTENWGIQLYTFRKAMANDAVGTLKTIAKLGFKQIESAKSGKGHYYGLAPGEMKKVCKDLGMTLRSGHVAIDDNWQQTLEEALESGQEYVICSSMPSKGQTVDNYKAVADLFNKAGEDCNKLNLKFGYHNHAYEFESDNGEVLYDILMDHTDPKLVHMEMDLGWVAYGGKNPLDYFERYPGRFPLWHLKDMSRKLKHSTEFGKGDLDIAAAIRNAQKSGVEHVFIEQEEYSSTPVESMQHNLDYLRKLIR
jgi:sugar phosphate isomerase/epimerase